MARQFQGYEGDLIAIQLKYAKFLDIKEIFSLQSLRLCHFLHGMVHELHYLDDKIKEN